MVEGPGCKLKGENIRARLKNKILSKIIVRSPLQANGTKRAELTSSEQKKQNDCNEIVDRKLDDVITLGKELFLIFGDRCLRLHFLMNGSHRITESTNMASTGKKQPPVLEVYFGQTVLFFYESSFDVRPSEQCLSRFEQLKDVDICSPTFNQKRAVAMVTEQKGRQLCDVLLDQNILPGVGNIIKNEALFDSGVNPCVLVDKLKPHHVSHIIKMTRDFTMVFYKCRKTGSPLNKHYKIYSLTQCKACGTRVTKTKMGDDSSRVTYFCPVCQTDDVSQLDKLTLPSKNSLLSWVQSSTTTNEKLESDWSCQACTLLNSSNRITCEVCGGSKINQSKDSSQKSDVDKWTNNCDFSFTSVKETRNSETFETSDSKSPKPNPFALMDTSGRNFRNGIPNRELKSSKSISKPITKPQLLSENVINSRKRTSSEFQDIQKENKRTRIIESELDKSDTNWKFPDCSGHKRKCGLWQTHKPGPNNRRWFFTCFMKGKQKCNHFEWADKYFPCCPGHNKSCTINTVLKIGSNNGRKFFSCSQIRQEQCQFFQWAEGYGGVAV